MGKRAWINLIIAIVAVALIAWGVSFYLKNFRGAGPAINQPDQNISEGVNETGLPLKIPDGFSMSIFAKNLPGARVMIRDNFGNFWVSQTSKGVVSLLEVDDAGVVRNQGEVFKELRNPHGLAINPDAPFALYIAEENKITRNPIYSEPDEIKIADLPSGGRHYTRTLGFGPDGNLYVSIGSSCNVCNEEDHRSAKIFSMDKDGKNFTEFAKGLRNAVFFAWHPETKEMWATEMGRDLLGDDLPPDEINIIRKGGNYGWPVCYGKNIHDTDFDKNTYFRNPCMEPFEISSLVDIPAHSAPLGIAFFPSEGWPAEYKNDLLVAYHGSWNRSVPTGYKVVRFKFDNSGNFESAEDFVTGWLSADGKTSLGRPVDIRIETDGTIFISDDKSGVIYKMALNLNQ